LAGSTTLLQAAGGGGALYDGVTAGLGGAATVGAMISHKGLDGNPLAPFDQVPSGYSVIGFHVNFSTGGGSANAVNNFLFGGGGAPGYVLLMW
jgi:hypothetical protein